MQYTATTKIPKWENGPYSSKELKALDNTKQSIEDKPKPRLVPYKAIATIRMLRINRRPIRTRHNRLQQLRQKGINRSNLQNIQISEVTIPKPNMQCRIAMVNVQPIRNKDNLLTQEIATNNINITLITETWLNDTPQDTAWLHQSDLLQAGHAISTHNRPTRGVGLALLYKQDMKIKKSRLNTYAQWNIQYGNRDQ